MGDEPNPFMPRRDAGSENPYVTYAQRMAGTDEATGGGPAGGGHGFAKPPLWSPWYGIGFGSAIVRCFRKTFIFHGRASRGEYWWIWLFGVIVAAATGIAAYGIGSAIGLNGDGDTFSDTPLYDFVSNAVMVAQIILFLPNLSLSIRRLHDENLRGWWVILPTVLSVGAFVVSLAVVIISSLAGGDSAADGMQTIVVTVLTLIVLSLLSFLVSVVLMIMPSDPRGVRFDRMPTPTSASENPPVPRSSQPSRQPIRQPVQPSSRQPQPKA
ncbi:hypothetical protein DSM100688_1852 [Bifidobacterium ramosum]|nr:DUF805 domain-containing protein [Bifidobacterium ramosum]KAB8287077.1 hypothetical protein DSM100688_1852 [Bifidobacterium ramosum]